MASFPKYKELKRPDRTGLPLSWGVWGPDDELGTLNHITEKTVRAAARLVKRGVRFNLDLPLHLPFGEVKPLAHRHRKAPKPHLYTRQDATILGRDDHLDEFFLQGSSQWDGLTHIGCATQGAFYNGVKPEHVTHGEGSKNGIDKVANFCVAGRGVLVDLARYLAKHRRTYRPKGQDVIPAKDIAACLDEQGVKLKAGDILLLRTGWVRDYLAAKGLEAKDAMMRPWEFSGISGREDTWEFLWNNKIAAVAADNVAVERSPRAEGETSLHLSIARMGFTIGEMFDFEALAEDCHSDGIYTCFFTSKPLNLRGGVGSPPNAMALK
jgi:kynurenine formamidase